MGTGACLLFDKHQPIVPPEKIFHRSQRRRTAQTVHKRAGRLEPGGHRDRHTQTQGAWEVRMAMASRQNGSRGLFPIRPSQAKKNRGSRPLRSACEVPTLALALSSVVLKSALSISATDPELSLGDGQASGPWLNSAKSCMLWISASALSGPRAGRGFFFFALIFFSRRALTSLTFELFFFSCCSPSPSPSSPSQSTN